jgi:hypothetical protein
MDNYGDANMNTQMQQAKDALFGDSGLRASNFKMFPGFSRDTSSESLAAEVVKMAELLKSGNYDVVADIGE